MLDSKATAKLDQTRWASTRGAGSLARVFSVWHRELHGAHLWYTCALCQVSLRGTRTLSEGHAGLERRAEACVTICVSDAAHKWPHIHDYALSCDNKRKKACLHATNHVYHMCWPPVANVINSDLYCVFEWLKCWNTAMWFYSSVHLKRGDIILCAWTGSPPLLVLLLLPSLLSPFSAGCHFRLILVLWGLSHSHKMQSELFCSSATWGNHPAVFAKTRKRLLLLLRLTR